MRKLGVSLCLVALLVVFSGALRAEVNVNVNFISGYYAVPQPTVLLYESRLNNWQDVATLFFLSKLTGADPQVILGWRLGGTPWIGIAQRLSVPVNVFYVPYHEDEDDFFEHHEGPPYGKAWGYWNRSPHGRTLVLTDAAIRNRVVLLGTSRYYGIPIQNEINLVSEHRSSFENIVMQNNARRMPHSGFDRVYFAHGKNIPLYRGKGNSEWKASKEHGNPKHENESWGVRPGHSEEHGQGSVGRGHDKGGSSEGDQKHEGHGKGNPHKGEGND